MTAVFQAGVRRRSKRQWKVCGEPGGRGSPPGALLSPVQTEVSTYSNKPCKSGAGIGLQNPQGVYGQQIHCAPFARAEGSGQEGALKSLPLHFDQFDRFNMIEIFHCFSRDEEI